MVIDTLPRTFSLYIVTLVAISSVEEVDAAAMLYVVNPLANILIAIGILECTSPLTNIVTPFALVAGTIVPFKDSLTLFFIGYPTPFVR